MPALTPLFVHNLETGMRIISMNEYQRLAKNTEVAWKISVEMPSVLAAERLFWLWDTAGIQEVNKLGDEIEYTDSMIQTQLYTHKAMSAGLRVNRTKFEDLDGGGINQANHWSRQIAQYAAYWPMKKIFEAVNLGAAAASVTYDNLPFFTATTGHPFNPFNTTLGRYDNVFTGAAETNAANGLNPGACAITSDAQASINSIFRAVTFIEGSLKMPNGVDPRKLTVTDLFYPTAMRQNVLQAMNAEFIAGTIAANNGTSGSTDIKALKSAMGRLNPVEVVELGAAYGGSDTTYYLGVERDGSEQGALVYFNREPFHVLYHNGSTDAELDRTNELEWNGRGRFNVGYGHPFMLFKCTAT